MFGWLGRVFLLRFLPRRLVPLFTVYEVYRFLRGRRAASRSQVVSAKPTEVRARVGR
jgi:hypothetical protein